MAISVICYSFKMAQYYLIIRPGWCISSVECDIKLDYTF